jgi:transcriptional regulator with XRE-family HTH domain
MVLEDRLRARSPFHRRPGQVAAGRALDSQSAINNSMASNGAAVLLREARSRAGLSQRALAQRANTAQSAIARIESGETSPSWDTLTHLLGCAGFELRTDLQPSLQGRTHMLDDVARILRLSPEQRLLELRNASRLLAHAKPKRSAAV